MSEVRIPFAIEKSTGLYVEVGDVDQGRQCQCLCPSCRQSVVARRGKINVWHFAHDKEAVDKPVQACEISFDVCCRQYAIELLISGVIDRIRTPPLKITEYAKASPHRSLSETVTNARDLQPLTFVKSPQFDVTTMVGKWSLDVFLAYPGRKTPIPSENATGGLLEIDISTIKTRMSNAQSRPGLLRDLITELFSEPNELAKRWIYHPAEAMARTRLRETLHQRGFEVERTEPTPKPPVKPLLPASPNATNRLGRFTCLLCNTQWDGRENTNRQCPTCRDPLCSRFHKVSQLKRLE